MPEPTAPTEIDDASWDRRRFLKASAGGAAVAWTAPTVLGLDARAFAVGSDPDCMRRFFDNFDQEPDVELAVTSLTNFTINTAAGSNVDVVVNHSYEIHLTGAPGKFIDLDGTDMTTPITVLTTKRAFCPGNYLVSIDYAGSHRGESDNSFTATLGSGSSGLLTPGANDELTTTFNATVTNPSGEKLVISHDSVTADNIGVLLLSVSVTPV
jgi:hypothetical protein